jgi:hypothetical protein
MVGFSFMYTTASSDAPFGSVFNSKQLVAGEGYHVMMFL